MNVEGVAWQLEQQTRPKTATFSLWSAVFSTVSPEAVPNAYPTCCSALGLAGERRSNFRSKLLISSHRRPHATHAQMRAHGALPTRAWWGKLRGRAVCIMLAPQTCMVGLWGPHSDRTPYVERERERERLSTCRDNAFCNGRHCLQSPPLLGTSDGPTDPDVYARRLTLGRATSSVPAAMTAASRSQQSASFFCSNCTDGDAKKVVCGESLKIAFLALHAAYETQTQRLATCLDRFQRGGPIVVTSCRLLVWTLPPSAAKKSRFYGLTCGFFDCITGIGAPTVAHVALSPWFGRRAP